MKIVEFFKHFPDEVSCKTAFKANRDSEGVTCKKCNGTEHYWLSTRSQYKCKRCDFRTTLNSGTMLQHTKLTYSDWFLAMHLLTCTKLKGSQHWSFRSNSKLVDIRRCCIW